SPLVLPLCVSPLVLPLYASPLVLPLYVSPPVLPLYASPQMQAAQLLPGQTFCLTQQTSPYHITHSLGMSKQDNRVMLEHLAPDGSVPILNVSFLTHVFSGLLRFPLSVSEAQSPFVVFLFLALVVALPSPHLTFYVSPLSPLLLSSISLLSLLLLSCVSPLVLPLCVSPLVLPLYASPLVLPLYVSPPVLPLYASPQMQAAQLLPGQTFCLTQQTSPYHITHSLGMSKQDNRV
ncbi:uncharacterized protein LOC110057159, partial [Orbicella faveolata]|uniref:uncharacterized protein LOC110057159 n=1 Tax=Orbicella faveolata TaxID=48498 RepID=UPI0009E5B0C9